MIRQVGQEALGLLGGGRAVLLQLAHPLVAAGVDDYSDFQKEPLNRLLGTLELMHTLVFDSRHRAEPALRKFHAAHGRIQGRLRRAAGRFPAGTNYRAGDPQLKLWVMATLVETSLITYQRFVASLAKDQQRRYYKDSLLLAKLFGIPERMLPPSLGDFQRYMADMLAGDTLVVTETARRLAWNVLNPSGVGIIPAGSARLLRFTTAGLLPPRIRHAYRLSWNPRQQHLLEMLGWTTKWLRTWVPKWVWRSPQLDGGLARFLLWSTMDLQQERTSS